MDNIHEILRKVAAGELPVQEATKALENLPIKARLHESSTPPPISRKPLTPEEEYRDVLRHRGIEPESRPLPLPPAMPPKVPDYGVKWARWGAWICAILFVVACFLHSDPGTRYVEDDWGVTDNAVSIDTEGHWEKHPSVISIWKKGHWEKIARLVPKNVATILLIASGIGFLYIISTGLLNSG